MSELGIVSVGASTALHKQSHRFDSHLDSLPSLDESKQIPLCKIVTRYYKT